MSASTLHRGERGVLGGVLGMTGRYTARWTMPCVFRDDAFYPAIVILALRYSSTQR
jgi:hypothetical protein